MLLTRIVMLSKIVPGTYDMGKARIEKRGNVWCVWRDRFDYHEGNKPNECFRSLKAAHCWLADNERWDAMAKSL